jgi:N4-gp56 family major capsid protein
MAATTVAAANAVDQWERTFHKEYVRDSRFKRYMGDTPNDIIQVNMVLEKEDGDDITFSLVTRLTGDGVEGDDVLEGNEESGGNYGQKVTVNQKRNGVAVGRMERKKTQIDLLNAYKEQLKLWARSKLRDDIIARFQSPNLDGTSTYATTSETDKDAWLAANADRVLFGAAKSNNAANDHSAALAQVDSTTDVLSPGMVSLAKRMARDADAHIRPVITKEDEEWYVLFANKWAFRDFKNNTTYQQAARDGWTRGPDNPIFRDGDLVWDGVIIREIVEIPVVTGVGASSIDVAPNFLCGAQAMFLAWGEQTHAIENRQDYENLKGVGVAEIRGVAKAMFNSLQHGLLTLYTAGVADT